MRSVSLGAFGVEVLGHGRVVHGAGRVAEVFELDVYASGSPLNLYPNGGHDPTNHLVIYWDGLLASPVYDELGELVGTKRGADFRTRFWPAVLRRVAKAVIAEQLGLRIGGVTDAQLNGAASLRDFLSAKPWQLETAGLSIDAFALALCGGEKLISLPRIPRGTVANIDCDFDSYALDGGTESETTVTVFHGLASADIRRSQFRFPLGVIPAGATVNDADAQFNVTNILDVANGTTDVKAYGTGGDDDPDVDTGADKYSKSASGTTYVSASGAFGTLGSLSLDLGATADGDIQGNISSPARFTLALKRTTESGTNDRGEVEALENAGTDPATLTIDYTAAGGGSSIAAKQHQYRQRRT